MYAIVRSGGRQERVAVGDVFELDRVAGKAGSSIELPALLLVDGESVTSDAESLDNVTVTAEVVDHTKGPKIIIQKYKSKTGYKKRQGHRQRLTQVRITGIDAGTTRTGDAAQTGVPSRDVEAAGTASIEAPRPAAARTGATSTEVAGTEMSAGDTSRTETGE